MALSIPSGRLSHRLVHHGLGSYREVPLNRVGAPVARGTSHRTGLVLFTSGSSGPRVATPVAGRFTTSSYPGLSTEARYILSSLALMQSVRGPFGSLRVAGPFRRPPIIGPVRLNSFAPIRLVLSSSSASAPSASQSVVRHGSIRNRRVGRCPPSSAVPRSVPVCPPVARPWSPSLRLRPCGRRFGAGFRRPCGNTRPSDFCRAIILRPFVLGTTARAEPGRSPWVRPAFFVATSSPIHPRLVRISDFAAGGRLTRRGCLTALRLRSIQPRTYDFHQTSPRGLLRLLSPSKDLVLQVDALVSSVSGSLRRAPGLDFHLLIAGHARRTPSGLDQARGASPELRSRPAVSPLTRRRFGANVPRECPRPHAIRIGPRCRTRPTSRRPRTLRRSPTVPSAPLASRRRSCTARARFASSTRSAPKLRRPR